MKPQLYGTPLSHFTRKLRVLMSELGVEFDFVRAPGVLATNAATYGDNPLLRVPTLVYGSDTVIKSDHIARYLVNQFDPTDRLRVCSETVPDLNRLAVVNGVMDSEVVLILAKRGGLTDLEGVVYFRKLMLAMENGLSWLDQRTVPDAETFDYGDICLICLWQHLVHYQSAPGLERYPRISARVARFVDRPSIASSAPAASLEQARAAGWQPG